MFPINTMSRNSTQLLVPKLNLGTRDFLTRMRKKCENLNKIDIKISQSEIPSKENLI